jgi:ATP-binding cassette subfamily B protein
MLIGALTEVISLGSVVPFLSVLVAPDKVLEQSFAKGVVEYFGISDPASMLLPFTSAFVGATILAGIVKLCLLWANNQLAFSCGSDLSLDIYRKTLYQPYHQHLLRNSSDFNSNLAFKVNIAVEVLRQSLAFLSSFILLVALFALLLAVDVASTLMIFIGFGASYAVAGFFQQKKLAANAKLISYSSNQLVKSTQEGLGGIRDVLLDGTQEYFCNQFKSSVYPFRRALGNNQFMAASPRIFMETLGMVLIAVFAYKLTMHNTASGPVLVMLGAIALGAQRMLPALQQIYFAWASISGSRNSLEDTLAYLDQPLPAEAFDCCPESLTFNESIHFRSLSFRYGDGLPWVLDDIELTIPKGTRVGFVGSTGSGKSTLLDLLMGLMLPCSGEVLVDGCPVDQVNRRAWQRNIAHVPQNIYLSDASIAENIAFGIPMHEIDMERVRQVARQARIAEFIESTCQGYEALVGERGVRLSGGQRQRIGIARALYKQVTLLVLDEATSALDNATESEVMEAVDALDRELTIVMVAHRLTTVKNCDMIIELDGGKLVQQGTFDYMMEHSASFRKSSAVNEY